MEKWNTLHFLWIKKTYTTKPCDKIILKFELQTLEIEI